MRTTTTVIQSINTHKRDLTRLRDPGSSTVPVIHLSGTSLKAGSGPFSLLFFKPAVKEHFQLPSHPPAVMIPDFTVCVNISDRTVQTRTRGCRVNASFYPPQSALTELSFTQYHHWDQSAPPYPHRFEWCVNADCILLLANSASVLPSPWRSCERRCLSDSSVMVLLGGLLCPSAF